MASKYKVFVTDGVSPSGVDVLKACPQIEVIESPTLKERASGKVEGVRCIGGAEPNAGQQSGFTGVSNHSGGGPGGSRGG